MERDEGHGRVAVVTGGASGIGLATATVLASCGWLAAAHLSTYGGVRPARERSL